MPYGTKMAAVGVWYPGAYAFTAGASVGTLSSTQTEAPVLRRLSAFLTKKAPKLRVSFGYVRVWRVRGL